MDVVRPSVPSERLGGRTARRVGAWVLVSALLLLTCASLPQARAASDCADSLVIDFRTESIGSWKIRPGDERFVKRLEIREEPRMQGWCLCVEADGHDPDHPPGNERVNLKRLFAQPVLIDSSTVISWSWWVRRHFPYDGAILDLLLEPAGGEPGLTVCFMSFSRYLRGPAPFDDPAGLLVRHSETAATMLAVRDPANFPPLPWKVIGIQVAASLPREQQIFLGSLRIGPPRRGLPGANTGAPRANPELPKASCICLADVNADGSPDRLIGQGNAPILFLQGRPDGSTLSIDPAERGLASTVNTTQIVSCDFDRDGRLDLACLYADGFRVFQGLGAGYFRERPGHLFPDVVKGRLSTDLVEGIKLPSSLLAADLLPAPGPELLVTRHINALSDSIYVRSADWTWSGVPAPSGNLGPPPMNVHDFRPHGSAAVADIDNDGDLDLFVANCELFLREPSGFRCASRERLPFYGSAQLEPVFGDVDRDGDLDVFLPMDARATPLGPYRTHDHSLLWRNDGGRFTDISDRLPPGTDHVTGGILEDFDLDGDLELFIVQSDFGDDSRPNLYLDNDGAGRFRPAEDWPLSAPLCNEAVSGDVNGDGNPDLVLIRREDRQVVALENPASTGRTIRVCVLDRRGCPDASGAQVVVEDAGRTTGFWQSGVSGMGPGTGVAMAGCAAGGVRQVTVRFAGLPPVRFLNLRAGARVVAIEPAGAGPLGRALTWADVRRRIWVDRLAGEDRPALPPFLFGAGLALGILCWPRAGRRRPWACTGLVGAGILCCAVVVPVWPRYPAALTTGLTAAVTGLIGAGAGAGGAFWESRRRKLSGIPIDIEADARVRLLEAVDGFSHANWMRDLGGIASLTSSMLEGGDNEVVQGRLRARLQSYDNVILPQMDAILEWLRPAGLDPKLEETFAKDRAAIETNVRLIRPDLSGVQTDRLEALSEAAREMHDTVKRIFIALGANFRAEVSAALDPALARVREDWPGVRVDNQVPPQMPAVFAVVSQLANVFENLLANAARAAWANAGECAPAVAVSATLYDELLLIRFEDSGTGVAPEVRSTIFESRSVGPGRGRGLPWARRCLRLWEGKIHAAEPEPGKGAAFVVTLRVLSEGRPARSDPGPGADPACNIPERVS